MVLQREWRPQPSETNREGRQDAGRVEYKDTGTRGYSEVVLGGSFVRERNKSHLLTLTKTANHSILEELVVGW